MSLEIKEIFSGCKLILDTVMIIYLRTRNTVRLKLGKSKEQLPPCIKRRFQGEVSYDCYAWGECSKCGKENILMTRHIRYNDTE